MPQDKIDKLNKMLELISNDTITPKQIETFLIVVLDTIKKAKDNFETLSKENLKTIADSISYIEQEHQKAVTTVDAKSNALQSSIDAKIGILNGLIKDVEGLKHIPGKDGYTPIKGEDYFDGEKGEQGEAGKDGSPDDGETIVKKINLLELAEEYQIDAKHIKNLSIPKGGYSPTVLGNAVDLNQSARADGYSIVWDDINKNFKFAAGGGAVTGLTGTPTEIVYIDNAGNGTSDSMFIRDPSDNFFTGILAETQAFLFIDEGLIGASFQATQHGAIGNAITLVFNGTDDVDTVVANWNTANPSNTVALILGTGTDVFTANTYTLSGGGVTGTQIGHHDIFFGSEIDGTAIYALDQTSGAFAGSIFGDASLLGIQGLSAITGYVDFAGNNFAAVIANSQRLELNYASPAGSSSLSMDSNGIYFFSQNNWGFFASDSNSEIGWSTPSYNLKLPTTTPNVGDSILVTSTGGGNYYTSWAAGGGAAGSDTWVQFNNAGAFGASSDFTWKDATKSLFVGDAGSTALVIDNVTGSTGFIMGGGVNSYFTVKNIASVHATLSLDTDNFGGRIGNATSSVVGANAVYFDVDNANKQISAGGLSKVTQSTVTFIGAGLDDMTPTSASYFTGNNATPAFTVTITNLDTQRIDMTIGGFTPPLPVVGDIVTDGTVTGTVYLTDGVSSFFVEGVTGGVFSTGMTITGPGGFSGVIQSTDLGYAVDRYRMDYGIYSVYNLPTITSPYQFAYGIAPSFASPTGHTIIDAWTWSYTVQYGGMLNMNGSAATPTVTIGDVNGLYGSTATIMNLVGGFTQYGGGHVNSVDYVGATPFTVKPSDYYIDVRVNSIGAAPDVYLPVIDFAGREFIITDEDGNSFNYPITIHAAAGQTFNITGTSTLIINTNFTSYTIHANASGNVWIVS